MLLIISEWVIKYFKSTDRRLANSLIALILPLFLLLVYKLVSALVYRSSLKSLPFRNLRGKTIILFAPSLDSIALHVAQELSKRGAQLLIALPSPVTDPKNLQLVLLLRQPDQNEDIFLETCLLDSPKDTLRFARQWLSAANLPTTTSRLDSIIFLTNPRHLHPEKPAIDDGSFLLVNLLMPYLVDQLKTGPPIRVIPLDPDPNNTIIWATFQHHLAPNPPLILIPSPPATSNCLWAILAPLSEIQPGLYHLRRSLKPIRQKLDQDQFDLKFEAVQSFIRSQIDPQKSSS